MPPRVLIASPRLLLSLLLVAIFPCVSANASAATARSGRLLVTLDQGAQSRATTTALQRLGTRRDGEQVPEIRLVTVRPLAGQTLAATAAILRRLPWVTAVTAERRHTLRYVPNDPALTQPETASGTTAGTLRQWAAARLNLFAAWDVANGTNARVAIIDSGIDANHPEFAGKIFATIDNDPTVANGPPERDEDGHGTHVASQACAAGNNGRGIVGTGLNCSLLVIKSDLFDASVIKSIVDGADRGVDAINMSFGNLGGEPVPPALVDAINYAIDRDVVLVAAAANNNGGEEQGDPANVLQPTGTGHDLTSNRGLSVTSADYSGARSSFAGRGSQISLAAYGDYRSGGLTGPPGILGAFPANHTFSDDQCSCFRTSINGDNRYGYLSGTSMAAPQVAGIAALVGHLNPDLKAPEIIRLLKETATRPAGTSWGPDLGWGIVNARAAIETARVIDRRPPRSKARGPKRLRKTRTFTLKWTGTDLDKQFPNLVPSGIRRYYIYRSKNGGPYRRIASTTKLRRKITTKRGARYRFYTIAVDRKGNREQRPSRADVVLRVNRRR
ncbi:MAG: S8 family peptidase [Solirubrobacteraceae bacterium]